MVAAFADVDVAAMLNDTLVVWTTEFGRTPLHKAAEGGHAMSPFWGHVIGIFTIVVMLLFGGIWVWAWLPYHKRTFDALAKLPAEDGEDAQ